MLYDPNNEASKLRRASLLRGCYPSLAPPPVVVEEDETGGAEVDAEQAKSRGTTGVTSAAALGQLILAESKKKAPAGVLPPAPDATGTRKRGRHPSELENDETNSSGVPSTAIIPVDPAVLRAQAEKLRDEETRKALEAKPKWALRRVMAGHDGRVRALCCEPEGQWFASGSSDTLIKVWDMATGKLKMDLIGHQESVRGLAVSPLSPYMYSCAEDRSVRCWDLERNSVVRDFHGHLSAVYSVACHPSQDIIVTGGRDSTVRVWDVRSRKDIFAFQGHSDSVLTVSAQRAEPQVISGGADSFIFLWDLVAGKAQTRLTRHKKPVRSIALHHAENTMVSSGADNIRKWSLPEGEFLCNMSNLPDAPDGIWDCTTVSPHNVLFVGSEDGGMRFYDWPTNTMFQHGMTQSVKGTVLGEGGILAATFDASGKRLLTGEGDKTIKMWREEEAKA